MYTCIYMYIYVYIYMHIHIYDSSKPSPKYAAQMLSASATSGACLAKRWSKGWTFFLSDRSFPEMGLPPVINGGPRGYHVLTMAQMLQGGAPYLAKVVQISPISLWFIGDISN